MLVDGRCASIEYSDLPDELAAEPTSRTARLRFWAGSPAIHVFDVDFLDRVTADAAACRSTSPARRCRTRRPEPAQRRQPATENALKFERFIFDVLPLAERWMVVETAPARGVRAAEERDRARLAGDGRAAPIATWPPTG